MLVTQFSTDQKKILPIIELSFSGNINGINSFGWSPDGKKIALLINTIQSKKTMHSLAIADLTDFIKFNPKTLQQLALISIFNAFYSREEDELALKCLESIDLSKIFGPHEKESNKTDKNVSDFFKEDSPSRITACNSPPMTRYNNNITSADPLDYHDYLDIHELETRRCKQLTESSERSEGSEDSSDSEKEEIPTQLQSYQCFIEDDIVRNWDDMEKIW